MSADHVRFQRTMELRPQRPLPPTTMPDLVALGRAFHLRRATAAEVVDLRWRVLRAGLPREAAVFDGDADPAALHYAAVDGGGGAVVSCATLHPSAWDGTPAYQLRGMATDDACRGLGLGRGLLGLAEADVRRATPVRLLWCNARTPAVPFYRRLGWAVRSETFDIPTAGPHVRMTRVLADGGDATG